MSVRWGLVRVLSWNLFHGRAVPPAGRDLFEEFAAALGRWEWDVALLQEVPPWWPQPLGTRLGAHHRLVLTSRNALLPIRRALAVRWPDLIKSGGGGCNAILVRERAPLDHLAKRLCIVPERRWVHAVRLRAADEGAALVWVANLHATAHHPAAARRDLRRATAAVRAWAGDGPAILGGDFNLRDPAVEGFAHAGGRDVDHIFVRGLGIHGSLAVLDRGTLSDHPPIVVELRLG